MALMEIHSYFLKVKQKDIEFAGNTSICVLCKVEKTCLNNVEKILNVIDVQKRYMQ
jgi:hypothetical protein